MSKFFAFRQLNIPSTAPSESTKSTNVVPESICQQGGLIYENFQNLRKKHQQFVLWNPSRTIVSVDMTRETWNEALNELQFKILPLLRRQLNTLPKLLNPPELPEHMNASKLQLITEIQSELDHSTDRVFIISCWCSKWIRLVNDSSRRPRLQRIKTIQTRRITVETTSLNASVIYNLRPLLPTHKSLKKPSNIQN
ncbi:hypothetical protein PCANC_07845 [Puccinia coronata f. sp. avenae]|uniref:Uncharacterized protein n=1 Tax=Puccinia coronata f. sp. avenae TaxID=200324 RepID=A0A2N5V821_9BASI|nr:hypothetical protein PCASD_18540 [Puccinia coronata f. sp. avenae]PLW46150.1 hypothetical protein PCASD_04159 [Puccinia coronata f. sp. avenae]PLW47517.1 hypothetical protein PCANC_07845 [Puccinia coronata f. sp. avenae]